MSEKLVRKVAEAALRGEIGESRWVRIDAPEATDKEISLAIMEAEQRGLVEARPVTHLNSPYPEWRLPDRQERLNNSCARRAHRRRYGQRRLLLAEE